MSTLADALDFSFAIIHFLDRNPNSTLGDAFKFIRDERSTTIDGASPMSMWEHFRDENGTGLRVHMAYNDQHGWGIPVVSQRKAIPNLIRYLDDPD